MSAVQRHRLISEFLRTCPRSSKPSVNKLLKRCGWRGLASRLSLVIFINCSLCVCWQGLEGEDEGAISMLSDNTAKLTSAVRYWTQCHLHHRTCHHRYTVSNMITTRESEMIKLSSKDWHHIHPQWATNIIPSHSRIRNYWITNKNTTLPQSIENW